MDGNIAWKDGLMWPSVNERVVSWSSHKTQHDDDEFQTLFVLGLSVHNIQCPQRSQNSNVNMST